MKLTIVMDGRFDWFNDTPYSGHMAYHPFVSRFLEVFDEVEICARAYEVSAPSGTPVTGPRATFRRIANYRGAKAFLLQLPTILKTLWKLAGSADPVLAYLPGTMSIIFGLMRLMRGGELHSLLVADPADQLSHGALDHPLRRPVRFLFIHAVKLLLRKSTSAMYVTRFHLQANYPVGAGRGFATSDVFIPDEAYSASPRCSESFSHSPKTLIYVAMMAQGYKGHDDLILAFAKARREVPDLRLWLVGDGPLREKIEELVKAERLQDAVTFLGKLPHGAELNSRLDASDIFVMPSRAEGLPRALIEAMARGLPAISTEVGGVSELLSKEYLVKANDPGAFAKRLVEIIRDADQLSNMSAANLDVARDYCVENTTSRMIAFYRCIKEGNSHAMSSTPCK